MLLLGLLSLLQLFVAAVGVAWKLSQGYAPFNLPSLSRLRFEAVSLRDDWPWFSLHLFLYLGQLIPLAAVVEIKSPLPERRYAAVSVLAILSVFFGFAAAMPAVSLWILWAHQRRLSQGQRCALRTLAWFSALTHVGAFLVAFTASVSSPWHVMNSLLSVPSASIHLSETGIRQARLRQINEMTGTSSGFFMAAGILLLVLRRGGVTLSLVTWMFLLSLVAGPAAGSAAVILLADDVAAEDGTHGTRKET
ncbi:hypothetical protein L249_4514 [Ophiocordyceps polyrhachis-furcata BCC 54312]|uniref:Uncharacterized protein n=1 Tax=Ophiocordyceps polyrhachis-furcata BCC 54312 TaxID=1330021 RepID=A0A367KZ82_9HYPO|nr:hypothetical protein L249_4514 [Ophiocordyceps polyrhachis-furcata BCC 54312]